MERKTKACPSTASCLVKLTWRKLVHSIAFTHYQGGCLRSQTSSDCQKVPGDATAVFMYIPVSLQGLDDQDRAEEGRKEMRESEASLEVQTEDEDAFLDRQEAFYASSRDRGGSSNPSLQQSLLDKRQE